MYFATSHCVCRCVAALILIPAVRTELEMSLCFALELSERNKSQHESDLDEQAVEVNRDIC